MKRPVKISPSLLNADFAAMGAYAKELLDAGADWLHLDVMDGHFVPTLSFGPAMVGALRRALPAAFLDAHLMVTEPDRFIPAFAEAGADLICIHAEASVHLHRSVGLIKALGKKAGVALNPATPPETLEWVLEELDLVLCMSVNPGYGGQRFIPSALQKLAWFEARRAALGLGFEIEVDGGVTPENAPSLREAGASVLVAGSSIVGAQDKKSVILALRG